MLDPIGRVVVGDMIELVGMSLCPPAASVLILRSAVAIRTVPPIVSRLADASFTIYILHFPIIIATKLALLQVAWPPYAAFLTAIAVGSVVSYAVHVLLVARYPVISFIFNGKLPDSAQPNSIVPA